MGVFLASFCDSLVSDLEISWGGPGRLGGQWQSDIRLRDICKSASNSLLSELKKRWLSPLFWLKFNGRIRFQNALCCIEIIDNLPRKFSRNNL